MIFTGTIYLQAKSTSCLSIQPADRCLLAGEKKATC